MRTRTLATALGALSVFAVSTAWAQQGGGFDASFNAFGSGGGRASGNGFAVESGIGQAMAGMSTDGTYALEVGIINGAEGGPSPSPTASPTAPPTPGPYRMFGPQVAKDGIN